MNALAPWLLFALGSAFFSLVSRLIAKVGVAGLTSNLATLIRTVVIFGITAAIVPRTSEALYLESRRPGLQSAR